jgi:hypothetical protein
MFAQAYMGGKRRGAAPSNAFAKLGKMAAAKIITPCACSESIRRIRFRPMYAGANMGHPSRTKDLGREIKSANARRPNWNKCSVT